MSWYPPPSSPGPITWLSDSPEATINLRGIYLNGPLQRVSWIFMEILRLKCFKYGSNMVCDISFKDCWGVQGSLEQNWSHFASHWLIRTAPSKHSPSVFVVGLQLVEWEKWIPQHQGLPPAIEVPILGNPEVKPPTQWTPFWSNQDRGCWGLGGCDAFISHSWSDDADAKWRALMSWKDRFVCSDPVAKRHEGIYSP